MTTNKKNLHAVLQNTRKEIRKLVDMRYNIEQSILEKVHKLGVIQQQISEEKSK